MGSGTFICNYPGIESERTIYYYEAGERVAPYDVMFAMMELYEADISDVIGLSKSQIAHPWGDTDEVCEDSIEIGTELMKSEDRHHYEVTSDCTLVKIE